MKKEQVEMILEWIRSLSSNDRYANSYARAELVGLDEDATTICFTVKIPKSLREVGTEQLP